MRLFTTFSGMRLELRIGQVQQRSGCTSISCSSASSWCAAAASPSVHRGGARSFGAVLVRSLQGFESVALAIILTKGYVCRSGCAEHEARFRERKNTLSDIAETITQGMQEASAAYGSHAILARTAARIRQRELALVAVRTAVRPSLSPFL